MIRPETRHHIEVDDEIEGEPPITFHNILRKCVSPEEVSVIVVIMALSQDDMKAQLKELMNMPENLVCVDCGDKRPMWASLIVPPPDSPFKEAVGCFCCYQCSGAHRRMGTHICFVRSTNLDECK